MGASSKIASASTSDSLPAPSCTLIKARPTPFSGANVHGLLGWKGSQLAPTKSARLESIISVTPLLTAPCVWSISSPWLCSTSAGESEARRLSVTCTDDVEGAVAVDQHPAKGGQWVSFGRGATHVGTTTLRIPSVHRYQLITDLLVDRGAGYPPRCAHLGYLIHPPAQRGRLVLACVVWTLMPTWSSSTVKRTHTRPAPGQTNQRDGRISSSLGSWGSRP